MTVGGGPPLEAVVLEGNLIRLEPMSEAHLEGLTEVGLDPEIWRLTVVMPQTRADMRDYMESGLRTMRDGSGLPFVTIVRDSGGGRIVGSTRGKRCCASELRKRESCASTL